MQRSGFSLHAFRLRVDYFLLEPITEEAFQQGLSTWLDGKKRLPYSERLTTNITMRRIIDEQEKKIYSVFSFLLAGTLCLSMAACGGTPTPAEDETTSSAPLSGALPVKALQPKHVDENPYMAKVMQTSITTATTPTQRMKFCRSASIRKSMFPLRQRTRTPHPRFTLTTTVTRSCHCSAASPSVI